MIISARPNFLALDFLRRLTSAVLLIMILITTSASAQQRFQTPEEAATALIQALRAGESRQLLRLMGPDSADIVISGDQVADVAARRRIIEAYEVKHRLETTSSDKVTLIIGNEEWPFAVPLSHQNGAWRFDTRVARAEILYRRLGAN